ncbi:hypothetical protein [Streptomyces sp. H27-D2]|uniref:hypothetical protein n=1 Tax=Streptomyces sp. H27-D2 TaxID=3046304 RepID=UPI002DBC58FA|nr:hypothetical protein [Streptomyces sp. H27-D2]MEC4014876.1 hypothetical protein [Streptomyces sp. H27-D2]
MSDGGGADLGIDQASLKQITEGLRGAIHELKGIGTASGAVMGAGFEELSLTGMEAGHSGLAGDFEGFCERWEWGVRALIQDANQLAERTGIAAGMLWEEDQYAQGTFKVAANAVAGNPHLAEDDVEKKGWGELFSTDTYAPDYSAKSFEQAQTDITQNWKDSGRTWSTNGVIGDQQQQVMDGVGVNEKGRELLLNETFGPSPEERAEAAQRQQQQGPSAGSEG